MCRQLGVSNADWTSATLTHQQVHSELAGIQETLLLQTPGTKSSKQISSMLQHPMREQLSILCSIVISSHQQSLSHTKTPVRTPVPCRALSYPSSKRSMRALRLLLIREWELRNSSSQFLKLRPVNALGLQLISCRGTPEVQTRRFNRWRLEKRKL